MKGKKAIYGFNDPVYAIICIVEDIKFKGTEILIVARCSDGTIIAPAEMFKIVD